MGTTDPCHGLCLSAQIIPQVGLHVPRSEGNCSVSGHTHSGPACQSLGLNRRPASLQRSCGCGGPTQAQTSLLRLSLNKEQPELSKDTFEESLFISWKKACLWFLLSPHTFPTLLKTAVVYLSLKNMHQCLRDSTCS